MTHKNKKRNFLTKALATASVATLMLGGSNAVFATPAVRTTSANEATYSKATDWSPNGPVVDGDSLVSNPLNENIIADNNTTVTFNCNGTTANTIQVLNNITAGSAGIVGDQNVTIKALGDGSKIVLGTMA